MITTNGQPRIEPFAAVGEQRGVTRRRFPGRIGRNPRRPAFSPSLKRRINPVVNQLEQPGIFPGNVYAGGRAIEANLLEYNRNKSLTGFSISEKVQGAIGFFETRVMACGSRDRLRSHWGRFRAVASPQGGSHAESTRSDKSALTFASFTSSFGRRRRLQGSRLLSQPAREAGQ